jgi:hypothetical protein
MKPFADWRFSCAGSSRKMTADACMDEITRQGIKTIDEIVDWGRALFPR